MINAESGGVWALRNRLRERFRSGQTLLGTFIKMPSLDVLDMVAGTLDFVVVDLEHSSLDDVEAMRLVRHAGARELPALVRLPRPDSDRINHFLEVGAVGIQLSMLTSVRLREELVSASRYAPHGRRSISLAHPTAGFGQVSLTDYLAAEAADPPILVGQIESEVEGSLQEVIDGLDVAFVGTTDLAVSLGIVGRQDALQSAVNDISAAAEAVGIGFGGWTASIAGISRAGLEAAAFVVIGSDLQILASGINRAFDRK